MNSRTLIILKPDSVKKNVIGEILSRFEKENFRIAALKMLSGSKELFEKFYEIHKDRPFFSELVTWMSSYPVVAAILEGEDAVNRVRQIVGATDPNEAAPGTIRKIYGTSKGENAIHASDSWESYLKESAILFPEGVCFAG